MEAEMALPIFGGVKKPLYCSGRSSDCFVSSPTPTYAWHNVLSGISPRLGLYSLSGKRSYRSRSPEVSKVRDCVL